MAVGRLPQQAELLCGRGPRVGGQRRHHQPLPGAAPWAGADQARPAGRPHAAQPEGPVHLLLEPLAGAKARRLEEPHRCRGLLLPQRVRPHTLQPSSGSRCFPRGRAPAGLHRVRIPDRRQACRGHAGDLQGRRPRGRAGDPFERMGGPRRGRRNPRQRLPPGQLPARLAIPTVLGCCAPRRRGNHGRRAPGRLPHGSDPLLW
mmetsp:Transcript_4200/g.10118  ORF Transcript_4200/g.10118 Transcript_4200/m.10118 type:complete len:203 (+) Transcript_4200:1097-1705(+)